MPITLYDALTDTMQTVKPQPYVETSPYSCVVGVTNYSGVPAPRHRRPNVVRDCLYRLSDHHHPRVYTWLKIDMYEKEGGLPPRLGTQDDAWPHEVCRLAFLSSHWCNPLSYTHRALINAQNNLDYFYNVLRRGGSVEGSRPPPPHFVEVLSANFNTPLAMTYLRAVAKEADAAGKPDKEACEVLRGAGALLGLLQADPITWFRGDVEGTGMTVERIDELVETRRRARLGRDYTTADNMRRFLYENGIEVEDVAGESYWRCKR